MSHSPVPAYRPAIPLLVAAPLFMVNLDQTIFLTALPQIALDLGVPPTSLTPLVTFYVLAMVAAMPVTGWLTDRFGSKPIFLASIALFSLASIGCACARSLDELILARICQGLGGGLMTPVARIVLQQNIPKASLMRAMAWYTTPALFGPALGPALGGVILQFGPWPLIFLVNIPPAIAALLAASWILPRAQPALNTRRFDFAGYGLIFIGLLSLMIGISGQQLEIPSLLLPLLFGVGLVLLWSYWRYAQARAAALIDLSVLRIHAYRNVLTAGAFYRMSTTALPLCGAIYMQVTLKWPVALTGVLLSCVAVGAICAKPLAHRILQTFGYYKILRYNAWITFSAIGAILVTLAAAPESPVLLAIFLIATGFSRSLQFSTLNTLNYSAVPSELLGSATVLSSLSQQLSIGLGVALAGIGLGLLSSAQAPLITLGILSCISHLCIFWTHRLPKDIGADLLA